MKFTPEHLKSSRCSNSSQSVPIQQFEDISRKSVPDSKDPIIISLPVTSILTPPPQSRPTCQQQETHETISILFSKDPNTEVIIASQDITNKELNVASYICNNIVPASAAIDVNTVNTQCKTFEAVIAVPPEKAEVRLISPISINVTKNIDSVPLIYDAKPEPYKLSHCEKVPFKNSVKSHEHFSHSEEITSLSCKIENNLNSALQAVSLKYSFQNTEKQSNNDLSQMSDYFDENLPLDTQTMNLILYHPRATHVNTDLGKDLHCFRANLVESGTKIEADNASNEGLETLGLNQNNHASLFEEHTVPSKCIPSTPLMQLSRISAHESPFYSSLVISGLSNETKCMKNDKTNTKHDSNTNSEEILEDININIQSNERKFISKNVKTVVHNLCRLENFHELKNKERYKKLITNVKKSPIDILVTNKEPENVIDMIVASSELISVKEYNKKSSDINEHIDTIDSEPLFHNDIDRRDLSCTEYVADHEQINSTVNLLDCSEVMNDANIAIIEDHDLSLSFTGMALNSSSRDIVIEPLLESSAEEWRTKPSEMIVEAVENISCVNIHTSHVKHSEFTSHAKHCSKQITTDDILVHKNENTSKQPIAKIQNNSEWPKDALSECEGISDSITASMVQLILDELDQVNDIPKAVTNFVAYCTLSDQVFTDITNHKYLDQTSQNVTKSPNNTLISPTTKEYNIIREYSTTAIKIHRKDEIESSFNIDCGNIIPSSYLDTMSVPNVLFPEKVTLKTLSKRKRSADSCQFDELTTSVIKSCSTKRLKLDGIKDARFGKCLEKQQKLEAELKSKNEVKMSTAHNKLKHYSLTDTFQKLTKNIEKPPESKRYSFENVVNDFVNSFNSNSDSSGFIPPTPPSLASATHNSCNVITPQRMFGRSDVTFIDDVINVSMEYTNYNVAESLRKPILQVNKISGQNNTNLCNEKEENLLDSRIKSRMLSDHILGNKCTSQVDHSTKSDFNIVDVTINTRQFERFISEWQCQQSFALCLACECFRGANIPKTGIGKNFAKGSCPFHLILSNLSLSN